MSENSFTDSDRDTFTATQGGVAGWEIIDLSMTLPGDTEPHTTISFFKADATKIIALIAEAAAVKPVPQTPEQIADFARRWDARVEAGWAEQTEDMGQ